MNTLIQQLKWQFVILYKNNLIAISAIVTVLYGLIFFVIKDLGNMEQVLTLLIYNDPAIIGLFFIGLSVLLEKNQNVLNALFVTPINHHTYLIAKILSLSILGWVCASGMAFSVLGWTFNYAHFSAGAFGTCLIFSLAGIFVVSYTNDFLMFMLKSIPVLLLFSLPLFNYFGLTDVNAFNFAPIQGCLNLIVQSYGHNSSVQTIVLSYISILVWVVVLYNIVYRIFVKKIINH